VRCAPCRRATLNAARNCLQAARSTAPASAQRLRFSTAPSTSSWRDPGCGDDRRRPGPRLRHRRCGGGVGARAGRHGYRRHRPAPVGNWRGELDVSMPGTARARHTGDSRPRTHSRPSRVGYSRGLLRERAHRTIAGDAAVETAGRAPQGITRARDRADRATFDIVVERLGKDVHGCRRASGRMAVPGRFAGSAASARARCGAPAEGTDRTIAVGRVGNASDRIRACLMPTRRRHRAAG
jgi:hypothetical protein